MQQKTFPHVGPVAARTRPALDATTLALHRELILRGQCLLPVLAGPALPPVSPVVLGAPVPGRGPGLDICHEISGKVKMVLRKQYTCHKN